MVICLKRGADLHMAQLMTMSLTVCCFSKIKIGFTFLVLADPGSPGHRAIKRVCVCVMKVKNTYPHVCDIAEGGALPEVCELNFENVRLDTSCSISGLTRVIGARDRRNEVHPPPLPDIFVGGGRTGPKVKCYAVE